MTLASDRARRPPSDRARMYVCITELYMYYKMSTGKPVGASPTDPVWWK